ncbi:hypothetical protein [Parasedimentitalea psychrophila]|uniref:Uncharacterized protein n=1 Tax=Parasedimentitalea psychrophila TaxID=2997337 RepID=A0A9Y2KXJ9_9RHOB|nr:hypothetical protein [Parasedimentitalea psychrophila]WIY24324.1 hypothetical protein QPJ95_17235 [Parasedimentitalea psychrophila]
MQLDHIELSQINFHALNVQKVVRKHFGDQDHSRWVFSTSNGSEGGSDRLFYKIWNRSHIRCDNILAALDIGFYDEVTTPALRALIFSGGICRGYAMETCQKPEIRDDAFFRTVAERTVATQHFAVQFGRAHTMEFRAKNTMIDLEGVYHIHDLALVRAHHSAFACAEYAALVAALYRRTFREDNAVASELPLENHNSWRRQPVRKALQTASKYHGKLISKAFPGIARIES